MSDDTKRLNWLIAHGYTPGRWRDWRGPGDAAPSGNGMVYLGMGGRPEIDEAIKNAEARNRVAVQTQS